MNPKNKENMLAVPPTESAEKSGSGHFNTPENLTFFDFWQKRDDGSALWIDQATVNNVAAVLAYCGYLLRVTPNHLSFAGALSAVMAFVAGLLLPAGQPVSSIILVYLLAQLCYAFDCADGLLARVSDTETNFGEFLDKSIDAASGMLCFGGVFGYLFRHYSAQGQSGLANLVLVLGFLFIVARSSRYFALNIFAHSFGNPDEPVKTNQRFNQQILRNLMDTQASTMGILLFLATPWGGLGLYACQTLILIAVYLRYFRRAYDHDKTSTQATDVDRDRR